MEYYKYLPDIFQSIEDYQYFGGSVDLLLRPLWEETERFCREMDIFTMEENLCRWEKILSLSAEGKSPEERRRQVLSRLNVRLPYTREQLFRQLVLVFEGDGIEAEDDPIAFLLSVGIPDHLGDFPKELSRQLRDAVPANMELYLYGFHKEMTRKKAVLWVQTADSLVFTERSSNGSV